VAVTPEVELPQLTGLARRSRELEKLRRKARRRVARIWLVALAAAAALYLASGPLLGAGGRFAMLAAVFALVVWGLIQTQAATQPYREAYKRELLEPLVQAVLPGFRHQPQAGMGEEAFLASRLFPSRPDRYASEDLFSGEVAGVPLRFAEVHAQEEREDCDDDGCRTHHTTIFRGLFAVAEFHKAFEGAVLVYPDRSERLLGALAQGWQRLGARSRRLQLIRLEDPRFERFFVVFADDPVTARYVLTPRLMEALVAYRERYGPVYASMIDGALYLALPVRADAFEPPPLWRGAVDQRRLRRHAGLLQAMRAIVTGLGMDVRLWGERARPEW